MKKTAHLILLLISCTVLSAQNNYSYWQQHVDYTMEVSVDVKTSSYNGTQQLVYTNNSPDDLSVVFYHLYFNAFQPKSEMDVRSLTIADPDSRVDDRISKLRQEDFGFLNVISLKHNNVPVGYNVAGTVLEVQLNTPIKSGDSAIFDMNFEGQIPPVIRRAGKDSEEKVALSMAQWYPKMAEYDFEGWHADPYISREFHGVWGDFDVKLTIDKEYTVGGTGNLQNPEEIGHGYTKKLTDHTKKEFLTWHFKAPNVHDFTWAADPNFTHDTLKVVDGPVLHFLYKSSLSKKYKDNWENLQPIASEIIRHYSKTVGKYPYEQYSIIQGGDGGMEYGMCTLITGERPFESLVGVTAHEIGHTWFQFLLASNESKHPWLDEGFAEYTCTIIENSLLGKETKDPLRSSYNRYFRLALSGKEQPMSTHADRFLYNSSYSTSTYSKGALVLAQLKYIIGEDNFNETLKRYFKDWAFKHPTPNDFIRSAEKTSGIELEWFLTDWTQTVNTIDYAVKSIETLRAMSEQIAAETGIKISLERIGLMPMPVEVEVLLNDGEKLNYYIPLQMMRGEKPVEKEVKILKDWAWAYPTYSFTIAIAKEDVNTITIDAHNETADINQKNNQKKTL